MRAELVTTLQRKATELRSELSPQKEPIMITQHGLPAAYLVDVQSYRRMEERDQQQAGPWVSTLTV